MTQAITRCSLAPEGALHISRRQDAVMEQTRRDATPGFGLMMGGIPVSGCQVCYDASRVWFEGDADWYEAVVRGFDRQRKLHNLWYPYDQEVRKGRAQLAPPKLWLPKLHSGSGSSTSACLRPTVGCIRLPYLSVLP